MWPNGYGPKWNINNYNDPMPCYSDSDESDSDEMLPLARNWNGPQSHRLTSEPVSTSVRPTIRKRPNVIAVETRKAAGVPAIHPVDMAPTPQVKVYENRFRRYFTFSIMWVNI